jgi:antitoxin PrlF
MTEATISSKSQITVPKQVREAMGVGAGDKIRFVPARGGFRLVSVRSDLRSLRGFLKGRRAAPLGIEEMNKTIAQMGTRGERAR